MSSPGRLRKELGSLRITVGQIGVTKLAGDVRAGMIRRHELGLLSLELLPVSMVKNRSVAYKGERDTGMRGHLFGQDILSSPHNRCVHIKPSHVRLVNFGELTPLPPALLEIVAAFTGDGSIGDLAKSCGALSQRLGAAPKVVTATRGIDISVKEVRRGGTRVVRGLAPTEAWTELRDKIVDGSATAADVATVPEADLVAVDPLFGVQMLPLAISNGAAVEVVAAIAKGAPSVDEGLRLAVKSHNTACVRAILGSGAEDLAANVLASSSADERGTPIVHAMGHVPTLRILIPLLQEASPAAIERIYAIAQRNRCDVTCAEVAEEWASVLKRLPVRWWHSSGIVQDMVKCAATPTFKLLVDACPATVADQDIFGASVLHHAMVQLDDADAVAAVASEFPHHVWLPDRSGRAPLEVAMATRRKWTEAAQTILRTAFEITKNATRPPRPQTLDQVRGIVSAALNARLCQSAEEVVRTFLPVVVADGTTPTPALVDMACAACAAHDLATLKLLVRHRNEVAFENSPAFSLCALGAAVANDCKPAAEFLLDSGALVGNRLVASGHSPLDVALRCGPTETAKLIMGHPDVKNSLKSAVPAALTANTGTAVRLLGDAPKQWPPEVVASVLCTRVDWCRDPDAWEALGAVALTACAAPDCCSSFVPDLFVSVASWPKRSAEHRNAVVGAIAVHVKGAGDAWSKHRESFEAALNGRRWAMYSYDAALALIDANCVRLSRVWKTQLRRAAEAGVAAVKAVLSNCFELANAAPAVPPAPDCDGDDGECVAEGPANIQTLLNDAVQVLARFLWHGNWSDALNLLELLSQQEDVSWPRVVLMPPVRSSRNGVEPSTLWAWRTLGRLQASSTCVSPHAAAGVIIRDSRIPTDAVSEFCRAVLQEPSTSAEAVLHCAVACAATGIGCDRRRVMSVLPKIASNTDDAELLRCIYPDELGFISSSSEVRWLSCVPEIRVPTSLIAFRRNGRTAAPVDLPPRRVYTMPWVFKTDQHRLYIAADPEDLANAWPSTDKDWSTLVDCPASHDLKYSALAATRGGSSCVLRSLQQAPGTWGMAQRRAARVALAACDRATLDAWVASVDPKTDIEELLPFVNAVLRRDDGAAAALKLADLAKSDSDLSAKMIRRAAVHRISDDDFTRFIAATGCGKSVLSEPSVAVSLASGKRTTALREVWTDLDTKAAYRCLWRLAVAGADECADLVEQLATPLSTTLTESVMMCCVQGSAYKILDACINRYGTGSAAGLRDALWCGGAGCPLTTAFTSYVTKHSAWSAALKLSGATPIERAGASDDEDLDCYQDDYDPRDHFMGQLWRAKATSEGGNIPQQCELAVCFLRLAPLAAKKSSAEGSSFHNSVISCIMCSMHPVPFAGALADHVIAHFSSGKGAGEVEASVVALVRELIDAKSSAGMKCLRRCAVALRGPAAIAFGSWAASLPTTTACMDALLQPAIASAHESAAAVAAMLTTAKGRDLFDRKQHLVDVLLVAVGLNLPPLLDWLVANSYTISSAVAAGEREETPIIVPAGLDIKYRKALVDNYDALVDVPQRTLRNEFGGIVAEDHTAQATKEDVAAALKLPPRCKVGLTVASVAEGITRASCFGMSLPQKLDYLLGGTLPHALKTIDVTVSLGDASSVTYSWDDGCLGVSYTVAAAIDATDRFFSAVNPDLPEALTA